MVVISKRMIDEGDDPDDDDNEKKGDYDDGSL